MASQSRAHQTHEFITYANVEQQQYGLMCAHNAAHKYMLECKMLMLFENRPIVVVCVCVCVYVHICACLAVVCVHVGKWGAFGLSAGRSRRRAVGKCRQQAHYAAQRAMYYYSVLLPTKTVRRTTHTHNSFVSCVRQNVALR